MSKSVNQYSIFLSSPSDLQSERDEIPQVISELNQTYGKSNDIIFELLKWETHSGPGIAKQYSQQLINEDIGEDYDIFIGIIWKKFGTQTPFANSGTEEEFLGALKRYENGENIQILFYFKTEPIPFDDIIAVEITKIINFKQELKKNNILFWSFENVEELKNQLRMHIPKRTDSLSKISNNTIKTIQFLPLESVDEYDANEFGILDFEIQFEDFLANANLALTGITESTLVISEEFSNKTQELDKLKKLPNFNKNLVAAILARAAKSVDNYTNRLFTETPTYQENFESAIKVGSLYLNNINKQSINENIENLESLLDSVKILKNNIPPAINGMEGFYDAIKNIPNLYSVFTKSKNRLTSQLEILQTTLKHSYTLVHEFEGEIEYKLKL